MLRKLITVSVVSVAGVVAVTSGVAGAAKGDVPGRNQNHGSTVTTVAQQPKPADSNKGKVTSGTAKNNKGHATTTTTVAP